MMDGLPLYPGSSNADGICTLNSELTYLMHAKKAKEKNTP